MLESYDPDGNITLYLFDFGDGVSTGWTTTLLMRHTYIKTGTYNTTLLVYDDGGLVSKHVVTITVVKERPSTTTTTTTGGAQLGGLNTTISAIALIVIGFALWYIIKKR